LVIADYSQQEATIIAGLSKDEKAIELFEAGKDIYLEVARAFAGGNNQDCADFRKLSKTVALGLNYGRSEYSIHEELTRMGLQISIEEVRSFSAHYLQRDV
jgi:DNA polymerase I-like protein with 3'-5' exonuclease and polymerase domains